MSTTIEADFFPPVVEAIEETSHALIVDNGADAAHPVEPSTRESGSSREFESLG